MRYFKRAASLLGTYCIIDVAISICSLNGQHMKILSIYGSRRICSFAVEAKSWDCQLLGIAGCKNAANWRVLELIFEFISWMGLLESRSKCLYK